MQKGRIWVLVIEIEQNLTLFKPATHLVMLIHYLFDSMKGSLEILL